MTQPAHSHTHDHGHAHTHAPHRSSPPAQGLSVLAWPAWQRVLVVLPVVLALWLAVWWANAGVTPW